MGFGPVEAIVILAVVLMIFGAGRLSGVGRAMGQGMREFRQESHVSASAEAETEEPDRPNDG